MVLEGLVPAAVTNTDGSVDSQVSANPAAGFSIVTYSGSGNRTIGHGLNRAPEMIIMKGRNVTDQWTVGHGLLNGGKIRLELWKSFK